MKNSFVTSGMSKKILVLLLSCILITLILPGTISCTVKDVFTLKDNNATVELKKGDSITIKLESNPTTGYGWMPTEDTDGTVISITSTEYRQAKTAQEMVGSGGYEYFYFKAISPGSTDIILNYVRPWEEGVEPVMTFRLSVDVK